jgi:hypothetical protein
MFKYKKRRIRRGRYRTGKKEETIKEEYEEI